MIQTVCVAGSGTMGSGIAQCAAQFGFRVILFDPFETAIHKAKQSIEKSIGQLVVKQKINETEAADWMSRLHYTTSIQEAVCDLLIEAIIEKPEPKIDLFQQVAAMNAPETILASNTSSLSIRELQQNCPHPERVAGLHFFNPATLMKLVEVVSTENTSRHTTDALVAFCKQLKKVPVTCTDAPGFIVNRVARHYYLEAMRLVEQGISDFESIDQIMTATGFKMGPFTLMDLIGMDINLAVSQSLYDALGQPARLKPSALQEQKVSNGLLGRKTGKGFYTYDKA